MKNIIIIAAISMLITGCTLRANPGSATVKLPGGVSVESSGGGSGKFCPPGQAKKGNC